MAARRDVARVLVLQQQAGNRVTRRLLQPGTSGRLRPPGPVVQRKIGFEFETGWTAETTDGLLKKFDKVGTGAHTGYEVESDDGGRIEFVVRPPLEIDESLLTNIASTFDGLDQTALDLTNAAQEAGVDDEEEQKPFTLDAATGISADSAFTIRPNMDILSANPQATFGLTLAQIAGLHRVPFEGKAKAAGDHATVLPKTFFSREKAAQKMDSVSISEDLAGLLMLLGSYLKGGETAVDYPKMITDTWLLARNDFPALLSLVPSDESDRFKKDPQFFAELVMDCVAVKERGLDQRVYTGKVGENESFGPTRGEWLRGIAEGKDLLSHAANEEFESMGKKKDDLEKVPRTSGIPELGGVFELRGGQSVSLEQEDWRTYAVDMAKAVMNLQLGAQQGGSAKTEQK